MRLLACIALLISVPLAWTAEPIIVTERSVKPVKEKRTVEENGITRVVDVERNVSIEVQRQIEPGKSAVIICDMWDDHWCVSAAKRCEVLAKKANPVIKSAREMGMTIIHCPSECMDFYKEHPARIRTLAVAKIDPPKPKDLPDPPLPIDDTDGGCDDGKTPFRKAWSRQNAAIDIDGDKDFITDDGKTTYSILKSKDIRTVFVMGVHTNMCVLNRGFAIKQLTRWDLNCLLVRDLTDAMYNPKNKPFVSHDEGTALVIRHIERHWCPSVLSTALAK